LFLVVTFSCLINRYVFFLLSTLLPFFLFAVPVSQPPAVFYGAVVNPQGQDVTPTTSVWTVSGNSEQATVSSFQTVSVNGDSFYIIQVPFETRKLADDTPIGSTANTLELTQGDTSYTRAVTVNGETTSLPQGKVSFVYGAFSQGLVERLDLVVGEVLETYEEYSQRVFGEPRDGSLDSDGDGQSNYEEYRVGTNANDAASVKFLEALQVQPNGSIQIRFQSLEGRQYRIERNDDLKDADGWEMVEEDIEGTGNLMSRPVALGAGNVHHFRIVVQD